MKTTTIEHQLIRAARILDSERSTTLKLLAGEAKWLRSSMATLFSELADPRELEHTEAAQVVRHANGVGQYLERLKAQNAHMHQLQLLAEELGVWNQWPSSVQVTVVFKEPKRRKG